MNTPLHPSSIFTGICRCAEDGSIEAQYLVIKRENLNTGKPVEYQEWRSVIINDGKVFNSSGATGGVIYILSPARYHEHSFVHKPDFFVDENDCLCAQVWFIDHRRQEMKKVPELVLSEGGIPFIVHAEPSRCPI